MINYYKTCCSIIWGHYNICTITLLHYSTITLFHYYTITLFHYCTIPLLHYCIISLFVPYIYNVSIINIFC